MKHILNITLLLGLASYASNAQTHYGFSPSVEPVINTPDIYYNTTVPMANMVTNVASDVTATFALTNQQYGVGLPGGPLEGGGTMATLNGLAMGFSPANSNNEPSLLPPYGYFWTTGGELSTVFKMSKYDDITPFPTGTNTSGFKGIRLSGIVDAFIEPSAAHSNGETVYKNGVDRHIDMYMGDLVVTFNKPVSNPVVHIGGLGGFTNFPFSGTNAYNTFYNGGVPYRTTLQGYSLIFELNNSDLSLEKLSGADAESNFVVSSNRVWNNATNYAAQSTSSNATGNNRCGGAKMRYGASGTVRVNGTNLTSVTFKIYLTMDEGSYLEPYAPSTPWQSRLNETSTPARTCAYMIDSATAGPAYTIATMGTQPMVSNERSMAAETIYLALGFVKVDISGNLFHDPNGANVDNSSGGPNTVPSGLFANLIDAATGKVIRSIPLNTDGSYTFTDANPGNQFVQLSNALLTEGTTPPAFTPPAGWAMTGAFTGTPGTGNSGLISGLTTVLDMPETQNTTNINLGIQQIPDSKDTSKTLSVQPVGGSSLALNGVGAPLISGVDPEDGNYTGNSGVNSNPQGVQITQLPTNGELWYDGVLVTAADILNKTLYNDPSKFSIKFVGNSYTTTSFKFAYVDAAGAVDPSPATYTLNWTTPVPLTLISFDAVLKGSDVVLDWITANEVNCKDFDIEHSTNSKIWNKIGNVIAKSDKENSTSKLSYTFVDTKPNARNNYYRLKQNDHDGTFMYGPVRLLSINKIDQVKIYPNPSKDNITIDGLLGGETIVIYNVLGKMVYETKAAQSKVDISLIGLSSGTYNVSIKNVEGKISTYVVVKK